MVGYSLLFNPFWVSSPSSPHRSHKSYTSVSDEVGDGGPDLSDVLRSSGQKVLAVGDTCAPTNWDSSTLMAMRQRVLSRFAAVQFC